MVGLLRFTPEHWTARLAFEGRAYNCDGLVNQGKLVDIGPQSVLEGVVAAETTEYFYYRRSESQVSHKKFEATILF